MLGRARSLDWNRGQKALRKEVGRVVELLRSVRNPAAPALGDWTVAEVAMHLSQAWMAVPGLAGRDISAIREVLPEVTGPSLIRDLWDLSELTSLGVRNDPERNPSVLADRIEQRATEYFAAIDQSAAADPRAWLVDGAEVALSTLTYHLLNETVVHGWDIARGDGHPWDVRADSACLVLEGFLVPILRALGPRDFVDQTVAMGLRATYEIRVKGCRPYMFVFDDGALSIEDRAGQPVDCIIEADPVAMLLVTWGRTHQAEAIVKRQLVASGPKAYLGPRFRGLMRNP
jgi:hypothetical protein